MEVCDVKKLYTFTTVETCFFVPEPLWNSDNQKLSNFKIHFFYRSVKSLFAVQLFLLPFSSHCSMQKTGFSDSSYVIKLLQPSSVIYGAPPFTGHRKIPCYTIKLRQCLFCHQDGSSKRLGRNEANV